MSKAAKTLEDRGAVYGDFKSTAYAAQQIKGTWARARQSVNIGSDQIEALDLIATKIARIVTGAPNQIDSWLDIEGYARLVRERLERGE